MRVDTPYGGGMPADPGSARYLLEAIVTAFSVLGGGMAYWSGFKADRHSPEGSRPRSSPTQLTERSAKAS